VLARPPIHGTSRLLPEQIAWRYLAARREPFIAPASPASPSTPASLATADAPAVVVADVEPPAALGLPRLASWDAAHGATLAGPSATPARVLGALGDAGEIVIHAHGIGSEGSGEASFLALSADEQGRYALTAGDVREATLRARPLVVLAACRASQGAPVLHEPWSLPAAFVYAGARAVVASTAPIPDREAGDFFDQVRAAVASGSSVAAALRDVRQRWLASGGADWVRDVPVFE
jgi:cellulose synthase operon protein C